MENPENTPLGDIERIASTRPTLTHDEWAVVEKVSPWLKAQLFPEVRQELEVEFSKKMTEEVQLINAESRRLVKEQMDEWAKEQAPLDEKELKTLLNQEYADFDVVVREGKTKVRTFQIVELPKESELRFISLAKKYIQALLEDYNGIEWQNIDGDSMAEKISNILDTVPRALDAASELVAICLDPWAEDDAITPEWVSKNMSTYRMSLVLLAQCEANRYRDFFSNGFRLFRTLKRK